MDFNYWSNAIILYQFLRTKIFNQENSITQGLKSEEIQKIKKLKQIIYSKYEYSE